MSEEGERDRLEGFDPAKHLRALRGRGGQSDYLDVKWRLVWLRKEHPQAAIVTEAITIAADHAVFRAQVLLPGGGSATGHGSETANDFGDFLEKAETKALGRALAALGYGTQFAQDFDMEDEHGVEVVDAGVERRGAPARQAAPIRQDSRGERYGSGPANGGGQSAPNAAATERQIKFVWAISREAKVEPDDLLEWTQELFGKTDIDTLTRLEASSLIEALQRRRSERA